MKGRTVVVELVVAIVVLSAVLFSGCIEKEASIPLSQTPTPVPSPTPTLTTTSTPMPTPTPTSTPTLTPTPTPTPTPAFETKYYAFTTPVSVYKTFNVTVPISELEETEEFFDALYEAQEHLIDAEGNDSRGFSWEDTAIDFYCEVGGSEKCWDIKIEYMKTAEEYYESGKEDAEKAARTFDKIKNDAPTIEIRRLCYHYERLCRKKADIMDNLCSAADYSIKAYQEFKQGEHRISAGNNYIDKANSYTEQSWDSEDRYDELVEEIKEALEEL